MRNSINILEALFFLYTAWYCVAYFKGWVKLSDDKETRRIRIVDSYGGLLLTIAAISFFCAIFLLWRSLN
jgi:hypothetical protein